jgi:glycosyltransferase involved in cell wall biosynthesis
MNPEIDSASRHTLTVVMPVYNEQDSLAPCVESWVEVLNGLGIDHEILVIDDGSRDSTPEVLTELSALPTVRGISKPNEGHGPTILRGYAEGVVGSEWVFQVDSDDEIPASAFAGVWEARGGHDAVLGVRTGRVQTPGRRLISKIARATTRLAYGARIEDANVPYRLIRSETLSPILDRIPPDTFAPNVVISGALALTGAAIAEVPVPHHERRAGEVSIIGLGALKAAARSFVQSVRLARAFRKA